MIKRLGGMLVILCLLAGCGINSNEVVNPGDVVQNDSNDPSNDNQLAQSTDIADGIFLKTVDDDLFYLDHVLNQYKLSDEVDYFDYDEQFNIVKIKKHDGRWVIWYLDNKKPEFISSADEIKFGNDKRKIFYTGSNSEDLFLLNSEEVRKVFDGTINMYDIAQNGEMVLILTMDARFIVIDSNGKVLYEKENILSYKYDVESETVKLWHDNQIDVVQLQDKKVNFYKVYYDITDLLMSPTYSAKFETTASLSNINFENGVGDLTVISKYYNQAFQINGVVSYALLDDGKFVYYLNEKNELYSLNIETQVTNFLGSGVSQFITNEYSSMVVYKSDDILYSVDSTHVVNLIGEDVSHYDFNKDYFAYTNSIQDLYLYQNGVFNKVAENVTQFSLGASGLYYTVDEVVNYKPYNGVRETMVDQSQYYKSIFFQNDELYKMKLTLEIICGYWLAIEPENEVIYKFDESQNMSVSLWDGEQYITKNGSYTVMVTSADVLNFYVKYENGSESYITISLVDPTCIQLSENEYFYTLKTISEAKALQLLND